MLLNNSITVAKPNTVNSTRLFLSSSPSSESNYSRLQGRVSVYNVASHAHQGVPYNKRQFYLTALSLSLSLSLSLCVHVCMCLLNM